MWYNSSADATKLGLLVRGIFTVGLIGTIVMILKFLGFDIDTTDINSLLDSVIGVIAAIGLLGAGIMELIGALRKVYIKAFKK